MDLVFARGVFLCFLSESYKSSLRPFLVKA